MTTHAQSFPRLVRRGGTWRTYLLAWLGGPVIGIANGAARELLYKDRVGDPTAHQLSTGSAIGLFAAYLWWLERRWPIPTRRVTAEIGATWVALTVAFEFGFGHYVAGNSWDELLADYDVPNGRLWPLVLVWLGIGPLVVRELLIREAASGGDPGLR